MVDVIDLVRLLCLDRTAGTGHVKAVHPIGYNIPTPLRTRAPTEGCRNRTEHAEEK